MKTMFMLALAGFLATTPLRARDINPACSDHATACPSPAVCTAPTPCPAACCPPPVAVCYPRPATTVTYIGSGHVYTRYYYASCNPGAQVIYFGGHQACQQGYQFNLPR
jgi:hypothetical protein